MSDPFFKLRELEVVLEGLADQAPEDIAEEAAPGIQADSRAKSAAGRGPDGEEWPLRKKDGAIALQRPAQTVTAAAVGAEIRLSGEDILKYHQDADGTGRLPTRRVFPGEGEGLPSDWEQIIGEAAETVFKRAVPE